MIQLLYNLQESLILTVELLCFALLKNILIFRCFFTLVLHVDNLYINFLVISLYILSASAIL